MVEFTETGHFPNAIQVTMSTGTDGATIFYTMGEFQYSTAPTHDANGNATGNTQRYTGPVTVSNGMKRFFRAIAYHAGMNDSEETSHEVDNSNPPQMPELADEGAGSGQPVYDHNGNLIHYKEWHYTYDAQNRLRLASNEGVPVAEYYYDGKNRQIARNLNGTIRFSVWDGWELLEEYRDARTTAYLQGATGVIKSWGDNGTIYYYQDKLGSTTHIADANGALLESYRYDLWGNPSYFNAANTSIAASGHGIVDLYAGERWVSELGLYDLRNRFMSSELGRFLQADPIGFKGDGSNLYRYAHNDPENFTDPMGLRTSQVGHISSDWRWRNACFFDSGNSFQGGLPDFFPDRWQAGMDGGGGGGDSSGGKSIASENEGAKLEWSKNGPTGNWNDTNINNHISERPEHISADNAAQTHYTITDVGPNEVRSTLNWYVRPGVANTDVVIREIQHVQRWLRWQKDGDGASALRTYNRNPRGVDNLTKTLLAERRSEIRAQKTDLHGGFPDGGRHNTKNYPPIPMKPADIQKALQDLRY